MENINCIKYYIDRIDESRYKIDNTQYVYTVRKLIPNNYDYKKYDIKHIENISIPLEIEIIDNEDGHCTLYPNCGSVGYGDGKEFSNKISNLFKSNK